MIYNIPSEKVWWIVGQLVIGVRMYVVKAPNHKITDYS